ncbi:MAG: response regulator [bacterium]|nr:response regulator [bacterium]
MDDQSEKAPPPKGSILLVEDDEFLRGIVARKLEEAGYEVRVARDDKEALVRTAEEMPDLLLLDLVLPGASGFELVGELRRSEATSKIPFIVLSNSGEAQGKKQSQEMGAAGYLVKAQSAPNDIIAAVNAFFSTRRPA